MSKIKKYINLFLINRYREELQQVVSRLADLEKEKRQELRLRFLRLEELPHLVNRMERMLNRDVHWLDNKNSALRNLAEDLIEMSYEVCFGIKSLFKLNL